MTNQQLRQALALRYPAAHIQLRDAEYAPVTLKDAEKLYRGFQRWMKAILLPFGAYRWVQSKGDCDKWARVFLAYVILRRWIGRSALPGAFAEILYPIDGDPEQGHSIVCFCDPGGFIYELEPQPENGLTNLIAREAKNCWSVDG